MIELIAVIAILVAEVAAFYLLDRQGRRFEQRLNELQDAHQVIERELLDRIQAPEVVLHRLNANGVEPELAQVGDGPWISETPDGG